MSFFAAILMVIQRDSNEGGDAGLIISTALNVNFKSLKITESEIILIIL